MRNRIKTTPSVPRSAWDRKGATLRVAAKAMLCALLLGAAGAARADDSVIGGLLDALGFGGGAEPPPAPAVEIVIDAMEAGPGDGDSFAPQLKKLLTAELYFVRKVCRPDAAQLAKIREAGRAKLRSLGQVLAQGRQRNGATSWPDVRGQLCADLRQEIEKVMPGDAARRYTEELAAREADRKAAAVGMMTALIDRRLSLTPKQFDEVSAVIAAKWQPRWSRDLQMFLYEDYAPMPDGATLRPLLSPQQRDAWAARGNFGTILFNWEHELGFDWAGDVRLDDLVDAPAPAAAPAEEAK